MGAFAAVAEQSYELPHFALFSTELLRDYFRIRGLGVFSEGTEAGERASAAFANAITRVEPPSERELAAGELGGCSSTRVRSRTRRGTCSSSGSWRSDARCSSGVLGPDWELHGVGTVERPASRSTSAEAPCWRCSPAGDRRTTRSF